MSTAYQDTLDYLYSRLPVFQHIGKAAYKADLNNTIALLRALGNPENSFRSIHIAGTNGKGSVSSLLAAIFTEHGYKTGLYTSPHLKDFRERIRINGEMMSQQEVIDFTEKAKPLIAEINPSFFELTVAMAFDHFRRHRVDMAIIEAGMGGRLDSTNVITPELSIITNIGYDHMEFLGDTLAKIAGEKAGIIKPGIPVVIGENHPESMPVFKNRAAEVQSEIRYADKYPEPWETHCPLQGIYQKKNLATVKAALDVLRESGVLDSDEKNTLNGISHVVKWSGLRGRWEILGQKPFVVADTAHNEHGLKLVMEQLKTISYANLHIVLGVVNDKDLSKVLPLFPENAVYHFCKPSIIRGLDASVLHDEAMKYGLRGSVSNSVKAALDEALAQAGPDDAIFIGGSTFVVAEALPDQSEA